MSTLTGMGLTLGAVAATAVVGWLLLRDGSTEVVEDFEPVRGATAAGPTTALAVLMPYTPVSGVGGTIKSVGSDTMNNLMTLWAEGFRTHYSSVDIKIEGKGSATAPRALIDGTATFGPMSREMKADEVAQFEKTFGYKPLALPTSLDMLAVFVHKDNPLASLTLPQLDAIYSKKRKGGFPSEIQTWGDLGLTGEWTSKPILLYGRNSASGTYGYFKQHALFKGDFKDTVKEQPGTFSVVQGVADDRYGIGYGGFSYLTADVRALPLAKDAQSSALAPTLENAYDGEYPLSRYLWLYVNAKPGVPLDPLRREFVRFIFSKEGQEVVVKDGYFPVTASIAAEALKDVGIR